MNFNEALLESMIYALAYVECVAKRYSWPPHLLSEETEAIDAGRDIVCLTASAFRTGALQFEITQLNMFNLTVCCSPDK